MDERTHEMAPLFCFFPPYLTSPKWLPLGLVGLADLPFSSTEHPSRWMHVSPQRKSGLAFSPSSEIRTNSLVGLINSNEFLKQVFHSPK